MALARAAERETLWMRLSGLISEIPQMIQSGIGQVVIDPKAIEGLPAWKIPGNGATPEMACKLLHPIKASGVVDTTGWSEAELHQRLDFLFKEIAFDKAGVERGRCVPSVCRRNRRDKKAGGWRAIVRGAGLQDDAALPGGRILLGDDGIGFREQRRRADVCAIQTHDARRAEILTRARAAETGDVPELRGKLAPEDREVPRMWGDDRVGFEI